MLIALLLLADILAAGQAPWLQWMALGGVLALAALILWQGARAGRESGSGSEQQAGAEHDEIARLASELQAAEAANAAKSRFLANVSHEIRSPLNAIYGYAQLVERGAEVDPQHAARVIRRSAEHLTNLVEGLLDLASVEQGVVRVDSGVVRAGALVQQVAEMFAPLAAQKGLAFKCELPDRLPEFVRMDERRVRQALINLVSNAVKFTEAGEVALAFRWSGQMAVFEVRDTGPGIADDRREAIFAPYVRDDAAEPQEGAGLGLAITSAIVRMLGGDLQLESAPGMGSVFRIVMMAPQVSGFVDRAAELVRPSGYAGPVRSILLVDDDRDHLAVLRTALGEVGFEVSLASDGPTALALAGDAAAQGRFDAAVLDVSMPGMTGWDVAAHLRAVHGPALKILMLSANADERHGLAGQAADHDAFLLKPVELGGLIDAIGRQLGLSWVYPQAASPGHRPPDAAAAISDATREHAERLKSLVRIGHVRALEGEIRALEQADAAAAPLVAKLYACLDRFDLAAMGKTLEEL
ncbi:MAG: hybrid sensor histidine kinase/response regulator [Novosphingobium sp.]|uniref:ATP-binding response regulator n=1 Tax=Novosphingobium sp. TaxID=1874826 RepID=UPI003B9CA23E